MHFVYRSRQENEELQAEYQRLQASYHELERIRDGLQQNENMHYTNVTDAQKELELSKSQASCNCVLVLISIIYGGWGQVPLSEKSKTKVLRSKFGLRPNLRLNLTLQQRLGLRIFLDRILVLTFVLVAT